MAGIKQSVSLRKKGGASEFYCFVTFFLFRNKADKIPAVLAPFSVLKATF
jgi:hypothetical protein